MSDCNCNFLLAANARIAELEAEAEQYAYESTLYRTRAEAAEATLKELRDMAVNPFISDQRIGMRVREIVLLGKGEKE